MNSGIVILKDGTPCFIHDEDLPPVKRFDFSRVTLMVRLIWDDAQTGAEKDMTLEYPLSEDFANLLEKHKIIGIGQVRDDQVHGLRTIALTISNS